MEAARVLQGFGDWKDPGRRQAYREAVQSLDRKIVVLDDDPTGIQTVHDVYVYTHWDRESILEGFESENPIFFVLTNSRGMTEEETERVHREIAEHILYAREKTGKEFLVISRSDSTLRGHYPLETETLRRTMEENGSLRYDGEIIMPFFKEGGRFTIGDVHYVQEGDRLIPAGETEFARDKTFGYQNSDLKLWVEEKCNGACPAERVVSISLEQLRGCRYDEIRDILCEVNGFSKVIVNAVSYGDVEVFATSLCRAVKLGKQFLFRTAAALPRVLAGIEEKGLLTSEELRRGQPAEVGGLVIAGSHVDKTTRQLRELLKLPGVEGIEFNQHLVVEEPAFEAEVERVIRCATACIESGKTAAVYTRRQRFDVNSGNKEDELRLAARISQAVTDIAARLDVRPSFIVAKGGITSSDIGTRALRVRKALVLGQILPGIPVWMTDNSSKFPGLPYIIFPGNVGGDGALREAVEILTRP